MPTIPLTQGKLATVDEADYESLIKFRWHARFCKSGEHFYAARNGSAKNGEGPRLIMMHRTIMGEPQGLDVDHKDGDGLNNSRSNLRVATRSQNKRNAEMYANNSSGYRGVYRGKNSWRAIIIVNQQRKDLGAFPSKVDAAKAYNAAALQYCGEFARLNVV